MKMPHNAFKAALHSALPQYGIWNALTTGHAAEIVATTGYDWMLIDGEHAPNTIPGIQQQLQAVAPYNTAPVVRAPHGDTAHEQLCLIVQVESRKGAENAAAIAAVDGVDAVFVGPLDLAASLGHGGQVTHPDVQHTIQKIVQTTAAAGKAGGILALRQEDVQRYRGWGCQFIAVALDVVLLRSGAMATLASYRTQMG